MKISVSKSGKYGSLKHQQGATLIVVLMILLMVTIIGVLAIRVALTSLNISTNSQIAQLNFQASDTPTNWMMQKDSVTLASFSNIIGAALSESETNPGAEYIFCFKPISASTEFAQTINATLIKGGTANIATIEEGGTRGFCDLTSDFGSNRQAVITQVAVTVPTNADNSVPGAYLPRGTNLTIGSALPSTVTSVQRIRMTITSMLPNYSPEKVSTIQAACLSTANAKISDNADPALSSQQTLSECLALKNVPVNTQVQEFNYASSLKQVTAPGA